MKFPTPEKAMTDPLALQELDDNLGTQTQDAYRAASRVAPHLNGLAVVFTDTTPHFSGSPLGLSGSNVAINPDKDFYIEGIHSGKASLRLAEFGKLYRSKGITPGVNELIVAIMLHEMGHAYDFSDYIKRASGDPKVAFELSRKVRKSEIATLPLRTSTAKAEAAWNNNTNGYKDKMRAKGYDNRTWASWLDKNTRAYANLPSEKVADRFALGVIATVSA